VNAFLSNVFLAAVWAFAIGEVTPANLLIGFVLSYAILWLGRDVLHSGKYVAWIPRFVEFLLYFLWELLLANLRVAYDVLTPTFYMRPGIIAVPLDARTDEEIMLLACVISLTPGTLSLDVSEDRQHLFVHAMYIRDPDVEKKRIKQGFERRLLELMR
jgi:multicomponent Na+:H+ antiporter subunit E